MPISINTNYAASAASKNLALSNSMLQRSLNRLSSGSRIVNPNDDAGGLAVSMRLSATAKRSGSAATNLNNAVSLLQNQDGVLKVGGRILERMSELQSLWNDTTKNDQDRALYDVEFAALRSSLTSLGAEKFNGVSLFGTTATNIITTADGEQTCTISAKGLGVTGVAGTTSTLTGAAAPANPVGAAGDITIGGKTVSVSTADTLAGVITKINAISGITLVGRLTAAYFAQSEVVIRPLKTEVITRYALIYPQTASRSPFSRASSMRPHNSSTTRSASRAGFPPITHCSGARAAWARARWSSPCTRP